MKAENPTMSVVGGTSIGMGGCRCDRLRSRSMKKLLILAVLVALGAVAAKRLRPA